jgi:hypothetical protein
MTIHKEVVTKLLAFSTPPLNASGQFHTLATSSLAKESLLPIV